MQTDFKVVKLEPDRASSGALYQTRRVIQLLAAIGWLNRGLNACGSVFK